MARKAATAAVLVLVLSGCGGGDGGDGRDATATDDPGEFMVQNLKYILAGQHERAYEGLHPAHQELVTREEYAACEEGGSIPPGSELRVREVADETSNVPGTDITNVPTKAVTIDLIVEAEGSETVQETVTAHAFDVEGEWKWTLAPDEIDECAGTS